MPFASAPLACILAALSALHVYWAVGGRWGIEASIPTRPDGAPLFQPGRLGALAVAGLLLWGAPIAAGVRIDETMRTWLLRAMAAAFGLRAIGDFRYAGFFKRVTGTLFARWDTRLYSPLCVLLSALALAASLA